MEPVKVNITVGEEGKSYQTGNFLTALDELVCWFTQQDKMSESEAIGALKLYTSDMEGWQ